MVLKQINVFDSLKKAKNSMNKMVDNIVRRFSLSLIFAMKLYLLFLQACYLFFRASCLMCFLWCPQVANFATLAKESTHMTEDVSAFARVVPFEYPQQANQ